MSLISLIEKIPFGNPAARGFWLYSKVPSSFLKKIEQENFRKTVLFVYEHSKFYRRKFDQHKINPKEVSGPEDLGDFFTTAENLREYVDEFVFADHSIQLAAVYMFENLKFNSHQ